MKIHAISTGRVEIKTKHIHAQEKGRLSRLADLFRDPHWSGSLPINAFVIEHPEGVIVVDTGDRAKPPEGLVHPFNTLAVREHVEVDDEIGPQLLRLGIRPADVRLVVMTHLHIDHDGGLQHLPKAEAIVAEGEYRLAAGLRGRLQGYYPQRWPSEWRPKFAQLESNPVGSFAKSQRLTRAGDVILVPTPGHTDHHQSVIVRDGELSIFLAGDTSYTQQGMLEGWPDGVGPSERAQLDTQARIRAYAATNPTVYLPSHDPDAARRLAERETTGLEVRG